MCFWNILCDNSISICVINAVNLAKLISKYFFMKKTFLTAFLAFGVMVGASMSLGQSNAPTCLRYPDKNQGYFVFNNHDFPSVNFWSIKIEQMLIAATDTNWHFIQEIRTPKHFIYIPSNMVYGENQVRFVIQGLSNESIVTEEEWLPALESSGLQHVHTVRCNGKTYHWALSVYNKLDENEVPNGGKFIFHSGGGKFLAFSPSNNINWLQNHNNAPITAIYSPKHYGVQYTQWDNGAPYQTPMSQYGVKNDKAYVYMSNIIATDNVRDKDGELVTGNSWVVIKNLGAWGQSGGASFETVDSGTFIAGQLGVSNGSSNSVVMPNQQGWITLINQFLNIGCACAPVPNYTGPGSGNSSSGFNITGSYNGSAWLDAWYKYFEYWFENGGNVPSNPKPIFPSLQDLRSFVTSFDGYEHDNDVPWWPANEVSHIFIHPISTDGFMTENPIQLSKHLLTNEDGTLNNYAFHLNEGLYLVRLFVANLGLFDMYIDIEDSGVQSFPLSNYLTTQIFPVPLTDNQDLLVVASTAFKMTYEYSLTDGNGNILAERRIFARAGEEQKFIFSGVNLPSGQLFHKFVFSDGSQVVYNSIKM